MSPLFKNIYRIPSARLKHWNYAHEALYFVTICTKNRAPYFGEIQDTILHPTVIGKTAHSEWYKSIELRPDMNLKLGEFVVMPNHIHGIIIIGENKYNQHTNDHKNSQNQFAPQSKNLGSIIRGYKSAVTTYARKNNLVFDWQSRFHEHIIRSLDEHHRISQYIRNNPEQWSKDRFYHST